jgi:hypothetical protein
MLGLAVLLPAFAALFAPETGYAIAEVLPARTAGWVGRTLTLPFAALLGKFGALLALLALLVALFVATIGWNPLGAAFRRARALRREEEAAKAMRRCPHCRPSPCSPGVPEPAPAADAATEPSRWCRSCCGEKPKADAPCWRTRVTRTRRRRRRWRC